MSSTSHPDEETALLGKRSKAVVQPTPLPKLQLCILMLGQLAEPICAHCITPFINQMIGGFSVTDGDPAKTGYYVGLSISLFFVTESCTVLYWSRLSDRIGRKPVLLIGLFGNAISMSLLGLAQSFWALVLARCVCGALNGNVGVAKSAIGELSDKTNVAQAFAFMPVVWAAGVTIAPFMGGSLQHPSERFPQLFTHPFWKQYPYFLPCFVAGLFTILAFIVTSFFFEETLQDHPSSAHSRAATASSSATATPPTPSSPTTPAVELPGNLTLQNVAAGAPLAAGFQQGEPALPPHKSIASRDARLSLSTLLQNPRIRIAVANYGLLAMLDIAYGALQPVMLATPVRLGGLARPPETIGSFMGAFGLVNGLVQAFLFTRVVRTIGLRTTFASGIAAFVPIWGCFAVANWIAWKSGTTAETMLPAGAWVALAVQASMTMVMDMSFGSVFIYITSAAPDRRSLGATNGIAQQLASIVRAIGPAIATSLFAFSAEHQLLGGYFVYVVLGVMTVCAFRVATMLPREAWNAEESDN